MYTYVDDDNTHTCANIMSKLKNNFDISIHIIVVQIQHRAILLF